MVHNKPASITHYPGAVIYMFKRVSKELLFFSAVNNRIIFSSFAGAV